jgi:hypothetical protein
MSESSLSANERKPTTIYCFEPGKDPAQSMRTMMAFDDPYSSESPVKRPLANKSVKRKKEIYQLSQSALGHPKYGQASMYSFIDSKSKDSLLKLSMDAKNPTPATINRRLLAANTNKNWCPYIS